MPADCRAGPKLYVVIAQLDDDSIAYFGSRITARNVLDRGKTIRAIFNGEVFDEVDDTIVTFRDEFDWIVWQDTLIVLDAPNFHAIFRDLPALTATVDANLATISQTFPLSNHTEFTDRIKGNPAMVVKLAAITRTGTCTRGRSPNCSSTRRTTTSTSPGRTMVRQSSMAMLRSSGTYSDSSTKGTLSGR